MSGHAFSALPIFVFLLAISWVATVPLQGRASSLHQGEYGLSPILAKYMAEHGMQLENIDEAYGSLSRQSRQSGNSNNPERSGARNRKLTTTPQAGTYNFDEIDHGAMDGLGNNQPLPNNFVTKGGHGHKRNIDEIDSSSFDSFFKRNLDEIDRVGWNSFVKRIAEGVELNNQLNQY